MTDAEVAAMNALMGIDDGTELVAAVMRRLEQQDAQLDELRRAQARQAASFQKLAQGVRIACDVLSDIAGRFTGEPPVEGSR